MNAQGDRGFITWRFDKNSPLQREEFIYHQGKQPNTFWAEGHKQNVENIIEAPMEATSCKIQKESRKTKVDSQTDIRPALS